MQMTPLVRTAGAGRPYAASDRGRAVAHAVARRSEGADMGTIARELGVSRGALQGWIEAQPFERVEVVAEQAPHAERGHTVHGPCGVRVDGLSLAEVAELMRRLS